MLKGADMAIYESITACNLHARLGPLRLLDGLVEPSLLRELEATKYINDKSINKNKQTQKCHIETRFESLQLATDEGYGMEESGRQLDEIPTDSSGSEGDPYEETYGALSEKHLEHREAKRWNRMVVWVNGGMEWDSDDDEGGGEGVNREVGRVYMAYGNQAELGIQYSSVAMVVRVPIWVERVMNGFGEVEGKMEGDVVVLDD
ncbi:hypothetical protein CBER1_05859 [Cercospora berteroae]|uniref:Uncharacterized protein n=1 Tax=Cercospora berteroae TaxID=357750 RepID=A0A2S6C7J7_9PEZI|nr:hypothetical protein CBER1_05859 [Cercospora berteroae]